MWVSRATFSALYLNLRLLCLDVVVSWDRIWLGLWLLKVLILFFEQLALIVDTNSVLTIKIGDLFLEVSVCTIFHMWLVVETIDRELGWVAISSLLIDIVICGCKVIGHEFLYWWLRLKQSNHLLVLLRLELLQNLIVTVARVQVKEVFWFELIASLPTFGEVCVVHLLNVFESQRDGDSRTFCLCWWLWLFRDQVNDRWSLIWNRWLTLTLIDLTQRNQLWGGHVVFALISFQCLLSFGHRWLLWYLLD